MTVFWVYCSEANAYLMMCQGHACLLLSGKGADMRTTCCYKFIQICVITVLPGDIGREASGTFSRHRLHMVMC